MLRNRREGQIEGRSLGFRRRNCEGQKAAGLRLVCSSKDEVGAGMPCLMGENFSTSPKSLSH